MKITLSSTAMAAALAATLCAAAPAMAQSAAARATQPAVPLAAQTPTTTPQAPASATGVTPPGAVNPSPGSPGAPSATAPTGSDTAAKAAGGASLMTGMSVKDNTGALIGEVSGLNNGVATIKMGADSFTVDSDKLGVANGAATINATQAELKKMLPPKK